MKSVSTKQDSGGQVSRFLWYSQGATLFYVHLKLQLKIDKAFWVFVYNLSILENTSFWVRWNFF